MTCIHRRCTVHSTVLTDRQCTAYVRYSQTGGDVPYILPRPQVWRGHRQAYTFGHPVNNNDNTLNKTLELHITLPHWSSVHFFFPRTVPPVTYLSAGYRVLFLGTRAEVRRAGAGAGAGAGGRAGAGTASWGGGAAAGGCGCCSGGGAAGGCRAGSCGAQTPPGAAE